MKELDVDTPHVPFRQSRPRRLRSSCACGHSAPRSDLSGRQIQCVRTWWPEVSASSVFAPWLLPSRRWS